MNPAVMAYFIEWSLIQDIIFIGYDENGRCKRTPKEKLTPERLKWDTPTPAMDQIRKSMEVANALIADAEMSLLVWTDYGKGLAEKLKVSPDGREHS